MRKVATAFMVPVVWTVVWEVLRLSFHEQFALLPSTWDTCHYFFRHIHRLLFHGWVTLKEMLLSLEIAFLIAMPLAWLMTIYQNFALMIQSYFIFFQCIPMCTLAPIMVTMFGWTQMAILIPTVLMIIFPLTINIYQGFSSVPEKMVQYFRFHGATPFQEFTKLRIPHARKHIFAGLRISAAIAGVGAVAGEGAGAQSGLGIFIQECRRNFDISGIFAGIFLLVMMSLLLYTLVTLVERRKDFSQS